MFTTHNRACNTLSWNLKIVKTDTGNVTSIMKNSGVNSLSAEMPLYDMHKLNKVLSERLLSVTFLVLPETIWKQVTTWNSFFLHTAFAVLSL